MDGNPDQMDQSTSKQAGAEAAAPELTFAQEVDQQVAAARIGNDIENLRPRMGWERTKGVWMILGVAVLIGLPLVDIARGAADQIGMDLAGAIGMIALLTVAVFVGSHIRWAYKLLEERHEAEKVVTDRRLNRGEERGKLKTPETILAPSFPDAWEAVIKALQQTRLPKARWNIMYQNQNATSEQISAEFQFEADFGAMNLPQNIQVRVTFAEDPAGCRILLAYDTVAVMKSDLVDKIIAQTTQRVKNGCGQGLMS